MGFWTGIIKAGTTVFETVDVKEQNIGENKLEDSDIKEIIMIDPRAMELLKTLASLGKKEEDVKIGIADTNDASPKKNGLGIYKTHSKGKASIQKRSLEDMTEILGKKSTERADDL